MSNSERIYIYLITISHLALQSDFAGVQGAKQPLAYKVERSATVAITQGSLLYARSTPVKDEILKR